MKTSLWAVAISCIVSMMASTAQADIVFDNGDFHDDAAGISDEDSDFYRYSSFVLAEGTNTITDVHWWGVYSSGGTPQASDDFTILFFSDDGGLPDILVAQYDVGHVGRTDTGHDFVDTFDIYEYGVDISPLALSANTTYWLAIINDTTVDTDDTWAWMWSNSNSGSVGTSYRRSDSTYFPDAGDAAFLLTNDNIVPEPASMVLLGLGLAGLAMRRNRAH